MASQSVPPNGADHENNVDCPDEALPYAQCLDPVLHASGELEGFTLGERRRAGSSTPSCPNQRVNLAASSAAVARPGKAPVTKTSGRPAHSTNRRVEIFPRLRGAEQRQPGAHAPPGPGQQLLPDLDQPPPDHPCRSAISQGRRICVAVGDDCCTEKVLKFAAKYIIKPCDAVTLLHAGGRAGAGPSGPAGGTRSGGSAAARAAAAAAEGGEPELLCRARATLVQSGKVRWR